jgi:hypothetical protein
VYDILWVENEQARLDNEQERQDMQWAAEAVHIQYIVSWDVVNLKRLKRLYSEQSRLDTSTRRGRTVASEQEKLSMSGQFVQRAGEAAQ